MSDIIGSLIAVMTVNDILEFSIWKFTGCYGVMKVALRMNLIIFLTSQ